MFPDRLTVGQRPLKAYIVVRIHVGEPNILWWKCLVSIRLTAALFPASCNPNIPNTSDFSGSLRFETLLLDLRAKPGGLSSDPRVFRNKLSVFSVDRKPLLTAPSNAASHLYRAAVHRLKQMAERSRKIHVGPLKDEKLFLLFRPSAQEADHAFYRDYDPEFLLKKAVCLASIYKQPAGFADLMNWPHDEFVQTFLGSIATELHCTAFHQCEALLALILAEYQNRPDWVYLSTYGTREIKDTARMIVGNEISEITRGANSSVEELVATAIYANCKPSGDDAAWGQSIKDIGWFLEQFCDSYLKGAEYNAYKHGLRVVSGAAQLATNLHEPGAELKTVLAMKHSLSFLEIGDTPEGYTAEEITKELSPDHSLDQIQIAAGILRTIRDSRIIRLTGDASELRVLAVDRDKFSRAKPTSSMSFSY